MLRIYIVLFLCSYSIEVYVDSNDPQRIILLAPSITEEIYLLGV